LTRAAEAKIVYTPAHRNVWLNHGSGLTSTETASLISIVSRTSSSFSRTPPLLCRISPSVADVYLADGNGLLGNEFLGLGERCSAQCRAVFDAGGLHHDTVTGEPTILQRVTHGFLIELHICDATVRAHQMKSRRGWSFGTRCEHQHKSREARQRFPTVEAPTFCIRSPPPG